MINSWAFVLAIHSTTHRAKYSCDSCSSTRPIIRSLTLKRHILRIEILEEIKCGNNNETAVSELVVSVCPPPKQVFCPLVIPFGHVREKRGIEGVRRTEGVFFPLRFPLWFLASAINLDPDGILPLSRGNEGVFFLASPFFFLLRRTFYLMKKAAHSQNVRWWWRKTSVRARSHRCLASSAAQGISPAFFISFFSTHLKIFINE